jgi:hypothetical protein
VLQIERRWREEVKSPVIATLMDAVDCTRSCSIICIVLYCMTLYNVATKMRTFFNLSRGVSQ